MEVLSASARANGSHTSWLAERRTPVIDVLGLDPELAGATGVDADRPLPAPAIELMPGPWEPPTKAGPSAVGLLVLDGVLLHRSVSAGGSCCEVLGRGDLLRPWVQDLDTLLPARSSWHVVEPTRVAVLDGCAAKLCQAHPRVMSQLLDRTLLRARRQATLNAISARKRVDDRILLLLAHLAARWGRVTQRGIVVTLPLTHVLLSELVCARRPSVTSALSRLRAGGAIEREGGAWVVTPAGRAQVEALADEGASAAR